MTMPDAFYAGGGIGLGPAAPARPVAPYPAPLVRSEDGVPAPGKTPVVALAQLAESMGWSVWITYAHGWMPNTKTGRPGKAPKETIAVRMRRGAERAVAVYAGTPTSWAWDTMLAWEVGGSKTWKLTSFTAFQDRTFGAVYVVAPLPWAKCKIQGTARWYAPWRYPGRAWSDGGTLPDPPMDTLF
jgi:hypothetical protein